MAEQTEVWLLQDAPDYEPPVMEEVFSSEALANAYWARYVAKRLGGRFWETESDLAQRKQLHCLKVDPT